MRIKNKFFRNYVRAHVVPLKNLEKSKPILNSKLLRMFDIPIIQ